MSIVRRLLIVLVALVALAAGVIYWFFSGDAMRRTLEQQATEWLGQPVRIGSASAQIFPRVAIGLGDVRVGEPVRLTLAEVDVSTGLRALLSRRVEDAELIVSNSSITMPLPFSIPESSAAPANAPAAEGGITVASIRAITLRDIRVSSRGREILVSAESSLIGSRLNVSRFTARSGNTSLEASGTVELEPRLEATLQASANELDLDDLIALADAFTPPPQPRSSTSAGAASPLVAGRITAKLNAGKGRAAGVELRSLATTIVAQGNRITLSPAAFELFGGRYEGSLQIDAGQQLAVTLASKITGLDVAQLAAFGGVAGTVSGTLSGAGRFGGRGADIAATLASATGNGDATIADGTIEHLDLVRTVILFFGRPASEAPAAKGNRFERMTASFALAKQIVQAESFALNSQDVDVAGSGTFTIPTKAIDGRAELLLSEALTKQAGTDLVRFTREGNRVALPATLGGTLDAPSVNIDAAAAVKRGLRNEMERQLKGIFDRFKPKPPGREQRE
jgi:uncharacterized protein involved in outer membrane biogenesis